MNKVILATQQQNGGRCFAALNALFILVALVKKNKPNHIWIYSLNCNIVSGVEMEVEGKQRSARALLHA